MPGLDPDRFLVILAEVGKRITAVLELDALGDPWREAEIVMTGATPTVGAATFGNLLQIAAFETAKRGCSVLIADLGGDDPWLTPLLAALADVRIADGVARIDLSDYGVFSSAAGL